MHAVPLKAGAGSSARIEAEVSWSSPQAYAFTFKEVSGAESVRLRVDMPTHVQAGELFAVEVGSSQDADVIVFFLEQDGRGGVLFPSSKHLDTKVQANNSRQFPALQANLRDPGQPSRETLVVYALTDPRDFERLRPPPGDLADEGALYAARLTEELAKIPMRRWARTTFTYVIEPKNDAGGAGSP